MGIMQDNLCHPYILSTTVVSDRWRLKKEDWEEEGNEVKEGGLEFYKGRDEEMEERS